MSSCVPYKPQSVSQERIDVAVKGSVIINKDNYEALRKNELYLQCQSMNTNNTLEEILIDNADVEIVGDQMIIATQHDRRWEYVYFLNWDGEFVIDKKGRHIANVIVSKELIKKPEGAHSKVYHQINYDIKFDLSVLRSTRTTEVFLKFFSRKIRVYRY